MNMPWFWFFLGLTVGWFLCGLYFWVTRRRFTRFLNKQIAEIKAEIELLSRSGDKP
jgi:hypothetical protein